jgi:hypothetical protein
MCCDVDTRLAVLGFSSCMVGCDNTTPLPLLASLGLFPNSDLCRSDLSQNSVRLRRNTQCLIAGQHLLNFLLDCGWWEQIV